MFSDNSRSETTILEAVNRHAIPLLVGAMLFVTGVAVVLGGLVLHARTGSNFADTALADYLWIVFWTGLAEGVALAAGLVVFHRAARRITDPLEKLSREIERLTATGRDETLRTDSSIREVNRLSESFNRLFEIRKRQTAELQELTRNVLHDIRTPLSHIRQHAELVHGGKAEPSAAMERIAEICGSLLHLVDTNADISANYAHTNPTPVQEEDLCEIIRELEDLYSAVAEAKRIRLSASLPEAPLPFLGHRRKLLGLVANLLDNAVKFTPEGGRISLNAEAVPKGIRLTVSDSGCGIAPHDLSRIYDRFFRADSSRSLPGNGLGLSLVHAIVTFYRGSIDCTSTPGNGTSFTVLLPREA